MEGLDGSGKSSVAAILGESAAVRTVESPPPPFRAVKQEVLDTAVAPARLLYFLAANQQVAGLLNSGNADSPLLAVRYLWSTIAYHAAIEKVAVADILRTTGPYVRDLPMPLSVIYLSVNRHTQIARLRVRREAGLQHRLSTSEAFYSRLSAAYEDAFAEIPAHVDRLDTSAMSLAETVSAVRRLIFP